MAFRTHHPLSDCMLSYMMAHIMSIKIRFLIAGDWDGRRELIVCTTYYRNCGLNASWEILLLGCRVYFRQSQQLLRANSGNNRYHRHPQGMSTLSESNCGQNDIPAFSPIEKPGITILLSSIEFNHRRVIARNQGHDMGCNLF